MSVQKGAPTPPRTCPEASSSAARPCAGGLSIASWGGVRGPFRWNFTFYIRLIVYVIKSPPRLHSHAPPARHRKPQRARSYAPGLRCRELLRRCRKRRMPKAASRKQTWDASPWTAVYGLRSARAFWRLAGVWEGSAWGALMGARLTVHYVTERTCYRPIQIHLLSTCESPYL
jgi:hypothetical protein